MLDAHHLPETPSPTPDLVRVPYGFSTAVPQRRLRTRVGSWLLASASLRVASTLHPLLGADRNHRLSSLWAGSIMKMLEVELDVTGLERVDPDRQYLVVALHEGFLDIPVLLHLPLRLRFTARDELFTTPHIGRYLSASDQIPIPESPTAAELRDLYADIDRAATAGDSVVVFPQGSILGVEIAFRSGVSYIARRLDLPVLPVVVTGTHRIWEYPFSTTVRYGQSVSMTVLPPVEPHEVTLGHLRALERHMKSIALRNSTAPPRHFVPERDGWWDDYSYKVDSDFPDLQQRVATRRATLR